MRNELEKQEGEHKELLSQLHNRHTSEMDHIGEQMMETENMRTTFEKEVGASAQSRGERERESRVVTGVLFGLFQACLLKEKLEQSRQENAVENEEVIVETRRAHEREKQLLLEETKRVLAELERVRNSIRPLDAISWRHP